MKKIIKEGTKQTITCENCGCLFSFEEEDIYPMEHIGVGKYAGKYVTCPQCESEIVLEQTR